jgi:P27 family predicted phage terminase small subunit
LELNGKKFYTAGNQGILDMRRIPTHLKLLRGNPGKRPIPPEPEPQVSTDVPEPPSFLTGYAADEWWRIGPELHRLGLLTVLDVAGFAAYCQNYARWRTAEETLAVMTAHDPVTHGLLIKRTDGNAERNPLAVIAAKAAASMIYYAGHFGMTPVARARIAAGVAWREDGGKFDGLIA